MSTVEGSNEETKVIEAPEPVTELNQEPEDIVEEVQQTKLKVT